MTDYYKPVSDATFEEIKKGAIEIWETYDDLGGYRSGKINQIKDIGNIQDNALYMVAMFDSDNQAKLRSKLSDTANAEIIDRIGTEYWS